MFRNWRERLKAAGGVLPKVIRATRKSSREDSKQLHSHEQQMAEMNGVWGLVDSIWWWAESESGTSFDRPTFQDLLDFCRANPRPADDPGRVEWWSPSRFGRILNASKEPDILAFMSLYSAFEQYGWQLHFVTLPRLGNGLADVINLAVHAYAAATYSKDLSQHAARGRRREGSQGWWVNGQAPWGTLRFDTRTGTVLKKGELGTSGGGGKILVPDPEILPHYVPLAEKLLAEHSFHGLGAELYDRGVCGPQGGALGHKHIKNFLTNRHLTGQVKTKDADGNSIWVKANWEPLVDVGLFERVVAEVERREREPRNKKRASKGTFLVRPVCGHCGIEYHGGRNSKKQGDRRTYVHPDAQRKLDSEVRDIALQEGCRQWTVDAEELETKLKDLILQERGSSTYEHEMRTLLQEREAFGRTVAGTVETARARLNEESQRYKRAMRRLALYDEDGLDDDEAVKVLKEARNRRDEAESELRKAEEYARSRTLAWDRLEAMLHETRNLAAAWAAAGLEDRRVLLDWWVLDVVIAVEPIPSKKKANCKTAQVTLRSDPNAPKYLEFATQEDKAAETSSRTHGSSSTARRRAKPADTDVMSSSEISDPEAICPSAQAACPRTSGSESSSADSNDGIASGDPQLPSATATLRSNPRRFARLTGEPLNRAENSSCESDIISVSGTPCTPGRAMNPGSVVGVENLRENGHTSWQMSHP